MGSSSGRANAWRIPRDGRRLQGQACDGARIPPVERLVDQHFGPLGLPPAAPAQQPFAPRKAQSLEDVRPGTEREELPKLVAGFKQLPALSGLRHAELVDLDAPRSSQGQQATVGAQLYQASVGTRRGLRLARTTPDSRS